MKNYYCKIDEADTTVAENIIDIHDGATVDFWKLSRKKANNYTFSQISSQALDLVYIASFVYLSDCLSTRKEYISNWDRKIALTIPVLNFDLWENNKNIFKEMLNFLTGDKWEFTFIPREYTNEEKRQKSKYKNKALKTIDCVSMLSGGLDSLVGAIDILENKKAALFVGLHGSGADVSPYQKMVFADLKLHYNLTDSDYFNFCVSKRKKDMANQSETTTRSRSFMFFAHGIAIADIFKTHTLIIPENGFISLNIPLTPSRSGSNSTRTTHPFYMHNFNLLLKGIKLDMVLLNPYQFKTKGEMMSECKNFNLLSAIAVKTMSCSHPTADRYLGDKSIPRSHCGYCVPCIIRRSSFLKANISEPDNNYRVIDIKNRINISKTARMNLKSFDIGIVGKKKIGKFDVLKSGIIPDSENISKYCETYSRGVKEIQNLFGEK